LGPGTCTPPKVFQVTRPLKGARSSGRPRKFALLGLPPGARGAEEKKNAPKRRGPHFSGGDPKQKNPKGPFSGPGGGDSEKGPQKKKTRGGGGEGGRKKAPPAP